MLFTLRLFPDNPAFFASHSSMAAANDELDLSRILSQLEVECDDIEYGFASQPLAAAADFAQIEAWIKEAKGATIVARTDVLESMALSYQGPFARITVLLPTSLVLVGLTAALASALTEAGRRRCFRIKLVRTPWKRRIGT
ncbi:MAG: hypothetical protein M3Y86_09480 [Verrucomicrobiota bacterium]|nr:hypothetical protein [Verrucomicrobiota bacterium]